MAFFQHFVLLAGAYGAVYKVKKAAAGWGDTFYQLWDSGSAYYAMKVPLEDDEEAEAAAAHEISVMEASTGQQCVNVLPLLQKDPCVDGKKMPNAFVTKLMPYDLDKWQRNYEVNEECISVKGHCAIFDIADFWDSEMGRSFVTDWKPCRKTMNYKMYIHRFTDR